MTGQLIGAWGWLQAILDFFGLILAKIYDVVGNYGIAIIIFTVMIRILIIPLGIKQVKSMHAMQRLAPQMKKVRAKYKNDRQKLNEETMKLYRENGVNPMGGCLPILLQMPVFFALYAVLTSPFPGRDNHIPEGSALYQEVIVTQDGVNFLGMNLLCSAAQAGNPSVEVKAPQTDETKAAETAENKDTPSLETLDCGNGPAAKIPYVLFLALMIAVTYYQNRQMMAMNPNAGQGGKAQQNIMKVMPLFFGFIGFGFPAGMVVYWVTSSAWQVGQSRFLLKRVSDSLNAKAGPMPPGDDEPEKPAKRGPAKGPSSAKGSAAKGGPSKNPPKKSSGQAGKKQPPRKTGFLERMAQQAEEQRAAKEKGKKPAGDKPAGKKKPNDGSSGGR